MDKRTARRLRVGDRVWYGDTRCMKDHRRRGSGRVLRVTEDAGILVEVIGPGDDPRPWWARAWHDVEREETWIGYHHIFDHSRWTGWRPTSRSPI
jgi:hypothetical protein